MRIMLIQGGTRDKDTCPGEDTKTKDLIESIEDISAGDEIELDILDLSVKGDGKVIQPCKGCVGTSGGFHCHWQCSCYGKGSASENLYDLMHKENVYDRLEKCDAFIVFTPIHWYAAVLGQFHQRCRLPNPQASTPSLPGRNRC